MALDLPDFGDLLDFFANWPAGSGGRQGPARRRVGRWTGWAIVAIFAVTAIAMFATWLKADSFATFDQTGLPVAVLGLLALMLTIALHVVAAIVANLMDRRRERSS